MTDTQLYFTIGIPSILIVLSWLSNKSDINSLRADNNAIRAEMNALRSEMINLRKEIYEALFRCMSAWQYLKPSRSNLLGRTMPKYTMEPGQRIRRINL